MFSNFGCRKEQSKETHVEIEAVEEADGEENLLSSYQRLWRLLSLVLQRFADVHNIRVQKKCWFGSTTSYFSQRRFRLTDRT